MDRKVITLFFVFCFLGFTICSTCSADEFGDLIGGPPEDTNNDTPDWPMYFGVTAVVLVVILTVRYHQNKDFHLSDNYKNKQSHKGLSFAFDLAEIDRANNRYLEEEEDWLSPNFKLIYKW